MLFGSQFPNTASVTKSGPFTLLDANYNALSDLRAGVPTLFTQTSAGSQTLTLTKVLTNDSALDINVVAYPYVLVGVVYCGNSPYEGQILPACSFTLNGKWGAIGAKTCQASIGPSGFASAWQVFAAKDKSGATPTTQLTCAMTANFQTSFGNFGLGELVVIGCDEIPIVNLSEPIVGNNLSTRSSNSTPAVILRNAYRQLSVSFKPMSRANAKGVPDSSNLGRNVRDALYAALRNGACVISTEWRDPGTSFPPNLGLLTENTYLANLISPWPSLSLAADDTKYKGQLTVEELT